MRIPDHPVPLQIISKLGRPITGTSANFSGDPSTLDAIDLQGGIGIGVDLVLESQVKSHRIESTILDLSDLEIKTTSGKKPFGKLRCTLSRSPSRDEERATPASE